MISKVKRMPASIEIFNCIIGEFACFCHLLIFSTLNFSKNSSRNTSRMLNILDPDQARNFVIPDLAKGLYGLLLG